MPWPVHPTGFFGASGDNDTYRIERSLRFNSADSAYLSRTPASAGNRKTWTWSIWIKRSGLGSSAFIGGNANNSAYNGFYFNFSSGDTLRVGDYATSGFDWSLETTQVFRDVSSWYHVVILVDTTQATSSNRVKIYVNGSQVTSFGTETYPSQNSDLRINTTQDFSIGRTGQYNGEYFSGYLTEINFIDGQALTPSSFGETDPITGRWKAKAYSGTYGTNGFYLSFKDNTSTTTLGYDDAGSNDWTLNNFSVTDGAGNDSLLDSPTNSGTSGNYCTISPFQLAVSGALFSLTNGNLDYSCSASAGNAGRMVARGTQALHTGKTYWEITVTSTNPSIGICDTGRVTDNYAAGTNLKTIAVFSSGTSVDGTSATYTGSSWSFTTNDIIGFAFDGTAMTLDCYKNGALIGTFSGIDNSVAWLPLFSVNTGAASTSMIANFGQRPFAYTAPTGFKALCTTNLPQPTIQKPSKYMDVVAYTGTSASNSISSLGFSPDLVWIKNRGTTTSHAIYDTTRGAQAQLSSDTTGDEVTSSTGLTAFGSNGFTVGTSSLVNTSGTQYVAWAWDEAPIAGFDIVSYTGNGANRTVSHNLGVSPKMLIVKARTTASTDQGWPVWHTSISNTTYLTLSTTSATATGADYWNSTSPTSSVFSLGTNVAVNANNDNYIAYLFAEVEGFSKFGSYTGNNSADGPFVWCGFRPRWVMVKCSSNASSMWHIIDTQRSNFNLSDDPLFPNSDQAETTNSIYYFYDIVSNGIKIRTSDTDTNGSGRTYIFAAFAESPFKYARAR